ncbi:hypothetical protein BOTBODRAFT_42523 [Botryobasidium botryosum FD-172 SS1]|uniref:Uncharacterized protein n=1 Tax=Botryobasidium botryosum (strain FD-172 SS1) TaxID=930990 RepID=A0A067N2T6_BOTB1|nr:hypothetical protein BOTBODRAFT_42523 [Botryobasidium botryosum FD-172 SS1]
MWTPILIAIKTVTFGTGKFLVLHLLHITSSILQRDPPPVLKDDENKDSKLTELRQVNLTSEFRVTQVSEHTAQAGELAADSGASAEPLLGDGACEIPVSNRTKYWMMVARSALSDGDCTNWGKNQAYWSNSTWPLSPPTFNQSGHPLKAHFVFEPAMEEDVTATECEA